MRFLFAHMVNYAARREHLEERFFAQLSDEGDTVEDIHCKTDLLLQSDVCAYCDPHDDDQMPSISNPDSSLWRLTPEQYSVASQIIEAVIHETHQLMILQGSVRTGKIFTVRILINALQACGKKCLICGTTGIAAVQYPEGTTLHSLFRLGIDEQSTRSFRSNIGRGTLLAPHILAADLIVINEASIMTPLVVNRVSMTLQSISANNRIEFGGKQILFVGDLLQLPPIVPNFSMPVAYRLITHLPYWPSIRKFRLQLP
jgi:hypothetical protein